MIRYVNAEQGTIDYTKAQEFFKSEMQSHLKQLYQTLEEAISYWDYDIDGTDLSFTCSYHPFGRSFDVWAEGDDVWLLWKDFEILEKFVSPDVDITFNITDPDDEVKRLVLSAMKSALCAVLKEQGLVITDKGRGLVDTEPDGECVYGIRVDIQSVINKLGE